MKRILLQVVTLFICAWAAKDVAAVPVKSPRPTETDAITIPRMLSYQGKLLDNMGNPVLDTTYFVMFSLYPVPSGGSAFWSETQTVRTRAGLFAALLGSVTPIGTLPDAGALYLGMKVGADPEMTPRVRIVSAAYAFKADTASYALAGGGSGDNAWVRGTPDSVLYTVHRLGIARGGANNLLYGSYRQSHVNLGVACTTGTSSSDPANITITGGFGNRAPAALTFVGGGTFNVAGGIGATVSGGAGNVAGGAVSDTCAVVAGGYGNVAAAVYATVGGGKSDSASGFCATVGGGTGNSANGVSSTIAGGGGNSAGGSLSAVGGGQSNTASGGCATVGGGQFNNAVELCATVGGGQDNHASGWFSVVPGGRQNYARGNASLAAGRQARANHGWCFVWGDSSSATSDSVYTTGASQWRVRAQGGAWFYSNMGMTSGAYLAPGSNAWTSACDSATKEDFRSVDRQELLDKVAALRVRSYKMKDQHDGTRHIGPVAQDFHGAFGYGETETGINMADADGIALAAIQALYEEVKTDKARIAQLEAELARIRK